ncbi:LysR family transcriptional regulator [Parasphingorhabdus marina]|uniref:LysR family transcriptional regulator n=1 Tax=Parasphingorhabdus marina TaxID=394732 RepID=UPI0013563B00|nr:LysR family transcriptional regulator [Parasphingorhabdus marina]
MQGQGHRPRDTAKLKAELAIADAFVHSSGTMRLRQIEIFYHVYRAGSISGAARDLHVSQPSVSKVLRYAEDQLGFDLFVRSKGRLFPTPEADELFGEVQEIYGRISAFNRTASNIRHRKGGHVRFGVLPSLSLTVLPNAIAQIREDMPDLSFELRTLHSDQIHSSLLEKKCDACVGFEELRDDRIATRQLGTGRLVLVSAEEIASSAGGVEAKLLDGAEYIGMKDSGPLASLLATALNKQDINPLEIVTVHTYHVALALVRKGVGMAIIDEFTANSYLGADLFRYPIKDIPPFSIYAASLADHPQRSLIDETIDEVGNVIGRF